MYAMYAIICFVSHEIKKMQKGEWKNNDNKFKWKRKE